MLAKSVSGDHVGEWSTKGGRATLATDDVLNKAVDIARLQVPPRAQNWNASIDSRMYAGFGFKEVPEAYDEDEREMPAVLK